MHWLAVRSTRQYGCFYSRSSSPRSNSDDRWAKLVDASPDVDEYQRNIRVSVPSNFPSGMCPDDFENWSTDGHLILQHTLDESRIPPQMIRCLADRLLETGAYVIGKRMRTMGSIEPRGFLREWSGHVHLAWKSNRSNICAISARSSKRFACSRRSRKTFWTCFGFSFISLFSNRSAVSLNSIILSHKMFENYWSSFVTNATVTWR